MRGLPFSHPRVKNYLELNWRLLYWGLVAPLKGEFFKILPHFPANGLHRRPGHAHGGPDRF